MYVDLVLVTQPMVKKPFICRCQSFAHLKQGAEVMVETESGNQCATVVDSITISPDDSEYRFIINATGSELPLPKVVSKISYLDYEYED